MSDYQSHHTETKLFIKKDFWDVILRKQVDGYQSFGGTNWLYRQGISQDFKPQKMTILILTDV